MSKSNLHGLSQPETLTNDPLHELIRQGARDLIAKAVETELEGLLNQYADVRKLVERALLRESCWHNPPVLHADNGAPMTSYTLKARLADLGMLMSHSRPRVSNDNPCSESLFRTIKYCPEWPSKGFKSLTAVRDWMLEFENAYNERHLHSGIRFVTPADRHRGVDHECLAHREMVYERAKRLNPRRWSGNTRNWDAIGPVALNRGKLQEVERNKLAP